MTTVTRYKTVRASGTGPRLELVTNLANNPRAVNRDGLRLAGGTGAVVTSQLMATGGPLPECKSFIRMNWTAAQTSNASAVQVYSTDPAYNLVQPGRPYIYSVYVRSSIATTMSAKVGMFNGSTYLTAVAGPATPVPANRWTQLRLEATAPVNCTRFQLNADPTSSAPFFPAGANMDVSAWMLFENPNAEAAVTAYGDGDMPGWEWLGTPHASPSKGYGAIS